MRITGARLTPFCVGLRAPVVTARGGIARRDGVLLALAAAGASSEAGPATPLTGCGASLPLAGFGLETLEASQRALEEIAAGLLGCDPREIDSALDQVDRIAPGAPSARAAADAALHDVAARALGRSLAAFLAELEGRSPRAEVPVNVLLRGTTPEEVAREARAMLRRGFRTLKLKVGAQDPGSDEERVAALRGAAGRGVGIRLDANGAWKESEAVEALGRFARHDIEYVEQPVAAGCPGALARVRAASPIRVAADEAVQSAEEAARLLARGAADLLIVKPAAVGGLRAARRIAARAREFGAAAVPGSLLDSSLGVAAALHFAASLPEPLPDCGLATGDLLADDLVPPLDATGGRITLPSGPGLGRSPDPAALRRCRTGPDREIGSFRP